MPRAWWSRSATAFTTRAARPASRDTDRAALRALQRGREWIWIAGNHDPDPAEGIGGQLLRRARVRPRCFPPRAGDGASRRRDRRPSAPDRARAAARAHHQPALLRRRRTAPGDAGLRGLYGRPQRARPRLRGRVRHPRPSRPTCWASGGSMRSRRPAVARIELSLDAARSSPAIEGVVDGPLNPGGTPPRRTSRSGSPSWRWRGRRAAPWVCALEVTNCSKPAL